MSRLQVLKQRAARGMVGVANLNGKGGWYVGTGVNGGHHEGPMSKREAIQMAARWAMPAKRISMYINGVKVD